jgi:hypothetical protein
MPWLLLLFVISIETGRLEIRHFHMTSHLACEYNRPNLHNSYGAYASVCYRVEEI